MDYRPETVALDRIDTADTTYRISTGAAVDTLESSISDVGLINPPLLTGADGGYVIVAGFRRVRACVGLGWKEMPARIAAPGLDNLALASVAIADNAFQRPLNLLESARAAALLARYLDSPDSIAAAAGRVGLSDSTEMTEKLLALSRLPRPLQEGVLDTSLSLPTALEIGCHPAEEATPIADLFRRLKPSLSRQREFLVLLREISRRESITTAALICEPDISAILDNPDNDRNRKTRLLRDYLKRRRFPRLTQAQDAFNRSAAQLRLGPGASLAPPQHFEGTAFTLTLSFSDLEQLRKHRDTLAALVEDPAMQKILDR